MKHEASCSCGQLKLSYDGEIKRTSVCHCLACQRRTGSVFGVQTRVARANSVITGSSTVYERTGDEGNVIKFHFCPKCGSTVYYEADWLGDSVAVPIGAFANPELPSPVYQVYVNRRHHWVAMPESALSE